MNQKLIDTLLGIADTTTDSYTKKHITHLVDCIILGNQEQLNHNKLSASEILKKHEDLNEMHLHDVDRKWIIEAMEEYAQQYLESYKDGWVSEDCESLALKEYPIRYLEAIDGFFDLNEGDRNIFIKAYKLALQQECRWIKVEDILPESRIVVIAYDNGNHEASYDIVLNEWFITYTGQVINPTHWQPLPTPPQTKTINHINTT